MSNITNIEGHGRPTAAVLGTLGTIYTDLDTGLKYEYVDNNFVGSLTDKWWRLIDPEHYKYEFGGSGTGVESQASIIYIDSTESDMCLYKDEERTIVLTANEVLDMLESGTPILYSSQTSTMYLPVEINEPSNYVEYVLVKFISIDTTGDTPVYNAMCAYSAEYFA